MVECNPALEGIYEEVLGVYFLFNLVDKRLGSLAQLEPFRRLIFQRKLDYLVGSVYIHQTFIAVSPVFNRFPIVKSKPMRQGNLYRRCF